MSQLKSYSVWDAGTRWFHWINVLCVLGLAVVGFIILNAGAIDVSRDGRITLKVIHVWIGYAFALNLLWRLVWAFIGNGYARWRSLLPGGKGYWGRLSGYIRGVRSGTARPYLGHNPAGRLAITALLLLLVVQMVTGLVLAGTDIFYPPFAHWIQTWIAAPGVDPSSLVPYARDMFDPSAYDEMRAWRQPFGQVHKYSFYALCVLVVLHVVAVIVTEVREGGGLISAMFTGRKVIKGEPADPQDP